MVTLAALSNELCKIAADQELKSKRLKKLKNTARAAGLIAAGTGTGYLVGGGLDYALRKGFGDSWQRLNPSAKTKLVGAGLGLTVAGGMVARNYLERKREEALKANDE